MTFRNKYKMSLFVAKMWAKDENTYKKIFSLVLTKPSDVTFFINCKEIV